MLFVLNNTNLLPSKWAISFKDMAYLYSDHLFDQTEGQMHQALKQATFTL